MILRDIQAVIRERIERGDPETSYVAGLHAAGIEKILKKISEESFELIMAGKNGTAGEVIHETADLIFHALVLLSERSVDAAAVMQELERRFGRSGIEEKESRKK